MKQEIRVRFKSLSHTCRLLLPLGILMFAKASAVPMIPMGPVDVSGTVVGLKWIPAQRIRGIPGMSGSVGVNRIIPAHFLAALRPYAGPDAELARLLNHMVGAANLNPPNREQAPATLVVWVRDVRPGQLKVGMRILLPAYTISGDEGGIMAAHDAPVIEARPRHGRRLGFMGLIGSAYLRPSYQRCVVSRLRSERPPVITARASIHRVSHGV
jgi:hypothetical protein